MLIDEAGGRVSILAADRSTLPAGAACFATSGYSRRTVYSMLPHSTRFNARPEIATPNSNVARGILLIVREFYPHPRPPESRANCLRTPF
jgi:hypothetical protein